MSVAEKTDLLAEVTENPNLIFSGKVDFGDYFAALSEDAHAVGSDVSSATRRKEINSAAFRVTRAKTTLDGAGKALNENARKEINKVDALRRTIRDKLDVLKDEVRRPLTKWEEQEESRIASHKAVLEEIASLASIDTDISAEGLRVRIARLEAIVTTKAEMNEFSEEATSRRAAGLESLRVALDRTVKAEEERAELARLRQEAAEREERDRREREAREKAEREAAEAKARAEREAEITRQAEARAARAAEEKAERERKEAAEAAERERQRLIREAKAAEERAEAERQRIVREHEEREARRLAEERQQREEAEARARDKAHREEVITMAANAIAEAGGIGEDRARKIVKAIVAGEVPNTKVTF